MKPHSAKRNPFLAMIEPLEARIAPAVIRIGAQAPTETISDTEYREFIDPLDPNRGPRPDPFNSISFVDTSAATDAISLAVDPLRAADGNNTFYVRLNAGDRVDHFSNQGSFQPLIVVRAGHVVAYFTDFNNNNEYDDNELTGLSLGANASIEIKGAVNGDIVTNLNEHGTRTVGDDTVDMNSLISIRQGIRDLKVLGGGVTGSVLSGGTISSLTITGNVKNVLAGLAAVGRPFDFFPNSAGGEGTAGLNVAPGSLGSSIVNAQVQSIGDRIEAGQGGAGGRGGSLVNIQITDDTNGFQLLAGAGGLGDVTVRRPNGGDGGLVRNVFITGVEDKTANSALGMVIKAGAGGDGVSTARGGIGGGISRVFVGFEASGGAPISSGELGADGVVIEAGAGGAGKFGGTAGSVDNVRVRVRTPDLPGDEVSVSGGLGGSSISPGGVAGRGGAVVNVDIRNQILTPDSDILIRGGNGGTTIGNSIGAAGGSIDNVLLLGYDIQLVAGNGSDGRAGGLGGSVRTINVQTDEFIQARNILIAAGKGGDASAGNGGPGGSIIGVAALQVDLASLLINPGIAGDGGTAIGGVGNRGGSVVSISIADIGGVAGIEGVADIRAGRGGNGTRGGGDGGSFVTVDIGSESLSLIATAGRGGDGLGQGSGGNGGGYNVFNYVSTAQVGGLDVTGVVRAGVGGDGVGSRKAGGRGGSAFKVSLDFLGDASIITGDGGSGQNTVGTTAGGAAGSGGSILSSGAFATNGSGAIRAGNAGVGGALPGNGGSIAGDPTLTLIDGIPTPTLLVGLHSFQNVTVVAGNGSHGGSGGDIRNLTYGSTSSIQTPTPAGTILLQAGNGSGEGRFAGRGGFIDGVNGSVGSAPNLPTTLLAGNGGGGPAVTASGNGGSISNVALSQGGGVGVVVKIQAGDAGDSPLARKGGVGGSVREIDIDTLDNNNPNGPTLVRSIGAGDGGDAAQLGGAGGSLVGVHLRNHDLGVRTGETFGYERMGGAFAGAGGAAIRKGLAGSVLDLNANAIASIVAGRGTVPDLAELVSGAYVNGSNEQLLTNRIKSLAPNGDFRLKFGTFETSLLRGGSSAANVEIALNALPGIANVGGVDVVTVQSGGYKVTFRENGARVPITGVETVPADGTEVIKGATGNVIASETSSGLQILPVAEFRSGQDPLVTTETVPGSTTFSTSQIAQAIDGANEVQRLDLSTLAALPVGEFTLSFGLDTTGPVAPGVIGLTKDATAVQIAAALNALPSFSAPNAGVAVTDSDEPKVFNITFLSGNDAPPISVQTFVQETQQIDLGTLSAFPTGKFTLTFLGSTTAELAVGATAAQVATALNALPTISAAAVGGVTVASPILGTFDITFRTIGDKVQLDADGLIQEAQTLTVGGFANVPAGSFSISFGDQTTAPLAPNAGPAEIQTALNALSGIVAAGRVTVTRLAQSSFSIVFGNNGEQSPLSALGLQPEVQTLGLQTVTGIDTSEFTLHIDHFAKITEPKTGTNLPVPVVTTKDGIRRNVLLMTTSPGAPGPTGAAEVQSLDLFPVLTFAGPTAEFYLVYNGTRTTFLRALASAVEIDAALEAIPAIAAFAAPAGGTTVGGVTVVADPNTAQAFNITFNINGDPAQISGFGGFREVQTINVTQPAAAPGGEVFFQYGNAIGNPLAGTLTAVQLDTALEGLSGVSGFTPPAAPAGVPALVGGATVTSPAAGRFVVTFNDFGNAFDLVAKGGGTANREVQRLDLSQFAAVPATTFTLAFGNGISTTLPVAATAAEIKTALDAVTSIRGVRTDNSGAVAVTAVPASPNVFDITFNTFGDQPDFVGLLTKGGGTTVRLPFNATPDDVKNALNAVSLAPTIVTRGAAPGLFQVSYAEFGDQPAVTSVGYVHEKQKIDLYQTGSFQITLGLSTTPPLPANATVQQVATALNALPSVLATGKPVTVTANGDSSYNVVFGADNDQLDFSGVQFEDLVPTTATAGTPTLRQIQFINTIKKGAFVPGFYRNTARLIGAIADINEIDSNVFKSFTDSNANGIFDPGLDTYHVGTFALGDVPIDGLVMAKRFDQVRNNATPEAKLTASGFFDSDDII